MTRLDPLSFPALWRGGALWVREEQGMAPWRLPPDDLRVFDDEQFIARARMAAGVRLHVRTDASAILTEISSDEEGIAPLDVVVDGHLHNRSRLAPGRATITVPLPPGEHLVELWLPQFGTALLHDVRLIHDTVVAAPVHQRTWLAYGSSITQGRTADGPSTTWPALVDRALGWSHSNLGMAGQCHLDPPVRRAIERSDVDLRLVCAGINVYQSATFGHRGLQPQLGGFLVDVLAAHPGQPLVIVSPIPSPRFEAEPNASALTLRDVRRAVESVGAALAAVHPEVVLISGPDLLHQDEAEGLLPDGLHPSQEGMNVIAGRLAPRLLSITGT